MIFIFQKCKSGERMVGECEKVGDKRRCESCEWEHWYYNETQMTCLPCACDNMTTEIKEICKEIGFNSDACEADATMTTPNTTPKAPSSIENDGEVWSRKYTIILVCFIASIAVCVTCFLICWRTRIRDWICKICCFRKATSSRPDTHTQNGNSKSLFSEKFLCNKILWRQFN